MRQSGACYCKKHTPVVFALNKIDEILLSAEAQEKSRGKLDNAAIEAAKCWVYEENSAVMGKMQTIALRL